MNDKASKLIRHFLFGAIFIFTFLANFSSAQIAVQWQKCLGTSFIETGICVYQTADDGYVIGGAKNSGVSFDFIIVKTDVNGTQQWMKTFGGSNEETCNSIIELNSGNFIGAGHTLSNDGDVSGNHGVQDAWIVMTDNAGNLLWQKCFGGTGNDKFTSIVQTDDGNFIATGSTTSNDGDVTGAFGGYDIWVVKFDINGTIITQKCIGGYSYDYGNQIINTADGGFAIAAHSASYTGNVPTNYGGSDSYIVRLDSALLISWSKVYGGTSNDATLSISNTSDGGFILSGNTASNDLFVSGNHGYSDYWVIKLDSLGTFMWQKCLGGNLSEISTSIFETVPGQYLVCGDGNSINGDITDPRGSGYDVWIAHIDSIGSIIDEKSLGGGDLDEAYKMTPTNDGGFAIIGSTFSNDIDVNGNQGIGDVWLVKIDLEPNTILGKLFIDQNLNSSFDSTDIQLQGVIVRETNSGAVALSRANGAYQLNVSGMGNFNISTDSVFYYNRVPYEHQVYFAGINQTQANKDFAFQSSGNAEQDLKISLTVSTIFNPGFQTQVQIDYSNVGGITMNGNVILNLPQQVNYISSNLAGNVVLPDSIVWTFSNLLPFETRTIDVILSAAIGTAFGTNVTLTATVMPISGDFTPLNNVAVNQNQVFGSFDPNDIQVDISGYDIAQASTPPYLDYLIRFQNTGNAAATFIRVANPLSDLHDFSTFELIATSHLCDVSYLSHSNNLEFFFDNIMLADSNSNEPESHGFIRYRIKPLVNLGLPDTIINHAEIYFDYNYPVNTNIVTTTLYDPTSISENPDNYIDFIIYPNPASTVVQLLKNGRKLNGDYQIQIFNIHGKKVAGFVNTDVMDVENLSKGLYVIELNTGIKKSFQKLIKL